MTLIQGGTGGRLREIRGRLLLRKMHLWVSLLLLLLLLLLEKVLLRLLMRVSLLHVLGQRMHGMLLLLLLNMLLLHRQLLLRRNRHDLRHTLSPLMNIQIVPDSVMSCAAARACNVDVVMELLNCSMRRGGRKLWHCFNLFTNSC